MGKGREKGRGGEEKMMMGGDKGEGKRNLNAFTPPVLCFLHSWEPFLVLLVLLWENSVCEREERGRWGEEREKGEGGERQRKGGGRREKGKGQST